MPDRGKVIQGLKCCCGTGMCFHGCPYYDASKKITECTSQLALEALDLLKEQEAKPVIVTTNAYGTRFYHCPKCNRDLYVYPRQLYCSNCGQELKWE